MNSRNVVGTTTRVFILADLTVLRAASKLRQRSFHRLATRLLLTALPVLALLLLAQRAEPQAACPDTKDKASDTLNVPEYTSHRPLVGGDYVVIEYDAEHYKTSWSDYKRFDYYRHLSNSTYPIALNGSFLPVIDTKEKIAVRVCGLRFTDVLTVTTSPTGVPEGGADIRGATPVPPPPTTNLTNTLDTLQSGMLTGGTTTLPGLGLSAPTVLPSVTVSGITPGSLGAEDQTPGKYPSYTPATVTVSGKQVALLLYSVDRNAAELIRLIHRTFGEPYDYVDSSQPEQMDISKAAPGSVNGVMYMLGKTLPVVEADSTDPNNFATFDKHLTDIQNINAQVSTLSGALTAQAFASNALLLLNNYSALTGILELARLGARAPDHNNCQSSRQPSLQSVDLESLSLADLKKITMTDVAKWTPRQVVSLSDDDIKLLPNAAPDKIQDKVTSLKKALLALNISPATTKSGDQPLCSVFEQQKFDDFWQSYTAQVKSLNENPSNAQKLYDDPTAPCDDPTGHRCFEDRVARTLVKLKSELDVLRDKLRSIDMATTKLYVTMNEWQAQSNVEQTDLLPPLTQNALVRISIVVQRGYTPFTLANAGGTFTPASTANNPIPAAVAAASTGTPAHAVKTILVEVHRVANFNLMGGVMLIHIPTAGYSLQASPTPAVASTTTPTTYTGTCAGQTTQLPAPASGTNPPAYSCVVQTQQTQWQISGMAGVVWFPWGHDYFPRHSGYANFGRNLLPSLLIATSVSSLGNSMGGVNWEPASGMDFYAGIGSAHRTVLPSGLSVNTALPSGAGITQITQEHAGFTVGVGFDLSVITSLFSSKSTSVATMP